MTNTTPFRSFLGAALLAAATLHSATATAEDIDLFLYGSNDTTSVPNILLMIDNSANWNENIAGNEKRYMIHEALDQVFSDSTILPDGSVSVGIMTFAHGNSPSGGKVVEDIDPLDDIYRQYLLSIFRGESASEHDPSPSADSKGFYGLPQGNNAPYALSFHEAYLYFGGREVRAGIQDDGFVYHDPSAVNVDTYISPSNDVCRNFAILIASGDPDSGENRQAERELSDLNGILEDDPINLEPSNFEANWADEYARFLQGIDVVPDDIAAGEQKLTTYVIDVHDDSVVQNRPYLAARSYLQSIANQGGGTRFLATTVDEIKEALESAVAEIMAVNSVFAATALPVSVNVRGTNLNQVYIGVFRPDANNRTRWFGNLKLYQLNVDESTGIFLADVDGERAQSSTTGFIRSSATSFWSHASTFWADLNQDVTPSFESDVPDGEVVEKGGVAQRLRELGDVTDPPDGEIDSGEYGTQRDIYTCTGSCLTTSGSALADTPFSTANSAITAADLGLLLEADADALIDWVRGEDNFEDEDIDNATLPGDTDVRASVHGDVLHSQPSIVNYGTNADEDVVVFYGANDGMVHAIRGGKDQTDGGEEFWSFVPVEFFENLDNLRQNSTGKTYFADGGLTSYVMDVDGDSVVEPLDGDKVYLYISMRRGGRFLYALDVTEKDNPKFLWRIDNTTDGFAELGQTWSEPRIAVVDGLDAPVIFFGAGYDPAAEDHDGAETVAGVDDSGSATQGRGLFAVNGETGALLWQVGPNPDTSGGGVTMTSADMLYSMPAAPTVIDRDSDGFSDRVYIPDTGGQVWRVNLTDDTDTDGPDYNLWNFYMLASVGTDQEFQYPVDVVDGNGGDATVSGQYDAVLVGSGDRENPFDTAVTNRFYMFKDSQPKDAAAPAGAPFTLDDLFDATDNTIQDGNDVDSEAAVLTLSQSDGWYITLENAGEKVVGNATTLAGTTFFNTNQPLIQDPDNPDGTGICSASLGEARNYAVSYQDATATIEQSGEAGLTKDDRSKTTPGGGFPPSPVPVLVEIDGEQHLAVISGTTVTGVPNIPLGVRERIYWNRENLDQ